MFILVNEMQHFMVNILIIAAFIAVHFLSGSIRKVSYFWRIPFFTRSISKMAQNLIFKLVYGIRSVKSLRTKQIILWIPNLAVLSDWMNMFTRSEQNENRDIYIVKHDRQFESSIKSLPINSNDMEKWIWWVSNRSVTFTLFQHYLIIFKHEPNCWKNMQSF